ncbi:MAG: beta-ketoacyl-ACP synthase III [Candidatus Eremiobacteraeota bacterium]|nr:beta-ketoacyl-ACP synthase III [Candidatus Eremiobacteraeota bacterium]MCW5870745.1 beta-ketoacyl-ACP synthase III [Candidatus Eremiobacteraeota bacterium]
MHTPILTGTGLWTPENIITNEELVQSFNAYAAGVAGMALSSVEFVEKASGIQRRYVVDKVGVLDPQRMKPRIEERPDEEWSIQCDISCAAARQALQTAGCAPEEIDGVIVGCSNLQRAYPAVAVEVQKALGCAGWAFDMNVACSSATFAAANAVQAVRTGFARRVLVINPEITSAHLNFRDRDSHFIFGDACTAMVIEADASSGWEIVGCKLATSFSNNIRNNFGFLNRCHEERAHDADKLFRQNGRAVFKEVVPLVARHLQAHLDELGIGVAEIKRFWLHQANRHMNDFIAKIVLGREATLEEAPVILNEFANTSSAGSVIAFHRYHDDLAKGDQGIMCSFGAGYSVGSVILRRL